MGMSFAYFIVKGDFDQTLLPKNSNIKNLNPFNFVLNESFRIKEVDNIAKKLSKKIENEILTVGYFDDDFMSIILFHNGKILTEHRVHDCNIAKLGKEKLFCQFFNNNEDKKFKAILKCHDCNRKIHLLSTLLNIQLVNPNEDVQISNKDEIEKYLKEFNEENKKVDNKYNLIQKEEVYGLFCPGGKEPFIHILDINDFAEPVYVWKINEHGMLNKIHTLPLKSNNIFLEIRVKKTYEDIYFFEQENKVYRLFKNGTIKEEREKDISGEVVKILQNDYRIYKQLVNNNEYKTYLVNDTGEVLAQIPNIRSEVYVRGHSIFYVDNDSKNIFKINYMTGDILNTYDSNGINYKIIDYDQYGQLYIRNSKTILCLDNDLNLVKSKQFDENLSQCIMSKNDDTLIFSTLQNSIIVVDKNKLEVAARKNTSDQLICVDQLGNIITFASESSINIYNKDLKIISKHKFNQFIVATYLNDHGDLNIITSTQQGVVSNYVLSFK